MTYLHQWHLSGILNLGNYSQIIGSSAAVSFSLICLCCWWCSHSLCVLIKTPSGESSGALPVPGHWCSDEKPLAEVFPSTCFLLLPGVCGGRQPSCGHPGQTAAGHHQEAGSAGDLESCYFEIQCLIECKCPQHMLMWWTLSFCTKCFYRDFIFINIIFISFSFT